MSGSASKTFNDHVNKADVAPRKYKVANVDVIVNVLDVFNILDVANMLVKKAQSCPELSGLLRQRGSTIVLSPEVRTGLLDCVVGHLNHLASSSDTLGSPKCKH